METDDIKSLQKQINALTGDYKSLRTEFIQYKNDTNKKLQKMEKQLLDRIERVYKELRKTQTIEKQKLITLEQNISTILHRFNK